MDYRDREIVHSSIDTETASVHVARTRLHTKVLMEERSEEIMKGLRHETPSMAKDRLIYGGDFERS